DVLDGEVLAGGAEVARALVHQRAERLEDAGGGFEARTDLLEGGGEMTLLLVEDLPGTLRLVGLVDLGQLRPGTIPSSSCGCRIRLLPRCGGRGPVAPR